MNNRNIQLRLPFEPVGGLHSGNDDNTVLFERLCSAENLFLAWRRFARGKRKKPDVMVFEHSLEDNIFALRYELATSRYRHGAYSPFIVTDPKQRQIHKATVKDRVVHQALYNVLEPVFEKRFIFDSYSCRVGKGTHAASLRLQMFLRRASRNNTRIVYALKLDIQKFFDSVDHETLLSLLHRHECCTRTMSVLEHIIGSFEKHTGRGLPLGNLTSQLFANVYMHELDHFMKHELGQRYYLRYCDDFIVVSPDKDYLLSLISQIEKFLYDRLCLCIHPHKVTMRKWGQGIDFVGYVHKPYCVVLRTKTKRRMLKRVGADNASSYLGMCSHANALELEKLIRTMARKR